MVSCVPFSINLLLTFYPFFLVYSIIIISPDSIRFASRLPLMRFNSHSSSSFHIPTIRQLFLIFCFVRSDLAIFYILPLLIVLLTVSRSPIIFFSSPLASHAFHPTERQIEQQIALSNHTFAAIINLIFSPPVSFPFYFKSSVIHRLLQVQDYLPFLKQNA